VLAVTLARPVAFTDLAAPRTVAARQFTVALVVAILPPVTAGLLLLATWWTGGRKRGHTSGGTLQRGRGISQPERQGRAVRPVGTSRSDRAPRRSEPRAAGGDAVRRAAGQPRRLAPPPSRKE
jgi:hypothetical protein